MKPKERQRDSNNYICPTFAKKTITSDVGTYIPVFKPFRKEISRNYNVIART